MAFLGALVALVLGVLLVANADDEGDLVDQLGDWISTLTTSEQERLDQLDPDTRAQVQQLLYDSQQEDNIRLHVGQTRRTPAQEKAAKAAGKTSGTLTVSWHELGRAVDLYPDDGNGAPDYHPTEGPRLDAFRTFQARAVNMGFRSLAFNDDGSKHLITNSKGKKIWDGGHIEWRAPYSSIAEAVGAEGTDEQKARVA